MVNPSCGEIVTPPAARDQAEASPQPVSFDDTAAESVVQIAGVDRIAESESDGGVEESLGAPVIVSRGDLRAHRDREERR